MKHESKKHSRFIPFENPSLDYALGFEVGVIYETLLEGGAFVSYHFHKENLSVVKEMCKAFSYGIAIKEHEDCELGDRLLTAFRMKGNLN